MLRAIDIEYRYNIFCRNERTENNIKIEIDVRVRISISLTLKRNGKERQSLVFYVHVIAPELDSLSARAFNFATETFHLKFIFVRHTHTTEVKYYT